jgi:hypothetical protein
MVAFLLGIMDLCTMMTFLTAIYYVKYAYNIRMQDSYELLMTSYTDCMSFVIQGPACMS